MQTETLYPEVMDVLFTKPINTKEFVIRVARNHPDVFLATYKGVPLTGVTGQKPAEILLQKSTPVFTPPVKKYHFTQYSDAERTFIKNNYKGVINAKEVTDHINDHFHAGKPVRTKAAIATQFILLRNSADRSPKPVQVELPLVVEPVVVERTKRTYTRPELPLTHWGVAEVEYLKYMHTKGVTVSDMVNHIKTAFGVTRTKHSLYSKITKINKKASK